MSQLAGQLRGIDPKALSDIKPKRPFSAVATFKSWSMALDSPSQPVRSRPLHIPDLLNTNDMEGPAPNSTETVPQETKKPWMHLHNHFQRNKIAFNLDFTCDEARRGTGWKAFIAGEPARSCQLEPTLDRPVTSDSRRDSLGVRPMLK